MTSHQIDEVREQIAKVRNEGGEVRGRNLLLAASARQSVIDQQRDGGKSADRNPKGYVPELLSHISYLRLVRSYLEICAPSFLCLWTSPTLSA
jgi:hypothetical protein